MRDDYRSIEGLLYSLGRAPDAPPARPRLGTGSRPTCLPRSVPRELYDRLDVSIGMRRLELADRSVLEAHYVLGVRQPGHARRRAIRALRATLAPPAGG